MNQSGTAEAASDEPRSAPLRPRPPRWRGLTAAAVVVVAAVAAAWWLFWSTPVVNRGGFGVTFYDAQSDRPYTVAVETLCLDGPESAVVDDVTVDRAGLTVRDFAVRPRPEPPALGLGSGPGSLDETGIGPGRRFSGQCDDGANTELAVELSWDGIGPAHTGTIEIHWTAGLRSGVLSVPVTITLCPAGDATEACAGAP